MYIHINIPSFTAGSIVDNSMKKNNMLLLQKPGERLSFERQKHETKNDISSRKTCLNTIWTLVKLGSIF